MITEFEEIEINSQRWFDPKDLLNEKWKNIKNYENLYKISNYGRVKTLFCWKGNKYEKRKIAKILKPTKQVFNYTNKKYSRFKIELQYKYNRKTYKIHRLVAEAFIPNPNNLPQVNHIDGNALNNRVDNLEWCTAKENIQHSFKYLRIKNIKYNELDILDMIKSNISPSIIIKENNISRTIYDRILKKNKLKPKGNSYWKNKYDIDLNSLKQDFNNGLKNKELAIKYKTNSNLIAKYRQKYKKGEI